MTRIPIIVCVLLAMAGFMQAQTTILSVTVGPEAALTVTNGTTAMSTLGTNFSIPFTGTTNLTYQIRTSKTGGTGSITAKVTTDFSGTGGPSVASPATGDALTYGCTVSAPGTPCTGSVTASTTTATSVATFGTAANSSKAGNSASTAWSLTDDPAFPAGVYTATVTYTISAT